MLPLEGVGGLNEFPAIKDLLFSFGNFSHLQFVLIASIFMATIFVIKAIFITYKNWAQLLFVYNLQSNISQRLFSDYLLRPYLFHLQVNSSKLMQNIEKEVQGFILFSVSALMVMTELLVVIGLGFLMFYVNSLAATIIIVLFSLYGGLMFLYYRKRLPALGLKRQLFESEARKHS